MIYKITNKQNKEWQGKPFVEAELIDEAEASFKVSAWAGEFAGDTWEGTLEKNDKGYWKLVSKKAVAGANFKSQQIDKVMGRKEESIGRFQDKKEEAIALASAQRDAVLIVTARGLATMSTDDIKSEILTWRNWFLSAGFTEHPPF